VPHSLFATGHSPPQSNPRSPIATNNRAASPARSLCHDWSWYLFRFDGRINRALLWQALLIVAVLVALLGLISQVIHLVGATGSLKFSLNLDFDFGLDELFKAVDPRTYRLQASGDRTILVLNAVGALLFFWTYLATAIKRLHDRGRSGWWIVPFFFVPRLLFYFWDRLPDANWFLPFDWAIHALWLWGIVDMFLLRGTSGSNRFGPDPLADIVDETRAARTPAWDQQSELDIVPYRAPPPRAMS
jgi:uncharacterized membrane protein YhaH (DUF805 family)